MGKRTLIIDDSAYMRTLIRHVLRDADYEIVGEAANGESAIDMALELNPDLITLDNILPDMLGTDVLMVLMEERQNFKIVMISAVGQQSVIEEGLSLGAANYIVKPFTNEELVQIVDEALLIKA